MDQRAVERKGRLAGCAATLILVAGVAHAGVYQWRDADGRVHFSDAPPTHAPSNNLSAQYDFSLPFEIVIDGIDYRIAASVRERLTSHVRKIFAIYKQALQIDYPQTREFRIVIYGSELEYRRYQRQVAPILENAAGFYNSRTNQITTWGMDDRPLLRLITHEVSHAISASHGRFVPTWLNEGLAEYFEQIDVAGLGARVPVSTHWLAVLKRRQWHRQPPDLRHVLDAPHQDWYAANGPDQLSYATSWSLVWFLMDSAPGRELVRELLATPQQPDQVNTSRLIAARWPGGLPAFTDAWRQWLGKADGSHGY